MKKIFLVAALAFSTTLVFAQNMTVNAGRTTFGLRAGVNFQNINGKDAANNNLENKIIPGFHAGVNAEIPVGTGSYLQPGVLFTTKGAKLENEREVKISYVEIPVNFIYKPILGTGNMVLGFGPYFGIGVGGKVTASGESADIKFTNTIQPTLDPQFRRLDGGANFLAGYEFANKLSFQLNAQLGLMDINPEPGFEGDKSRQRNTGWGLSLGYRF